MTENLSGKKIAFLLTDGVEQVEFTEPWNALKAAGATVRLVSPKAVDVLGMHHIDKADTFAVDLRSADASADDFDALVLPGGAINSDDLRTDAASVALVRAFFEQDKPVGAICHAPWILAEADVLRGRSVTSWPSIATDLRNAGAEWSDEEVVVDEGLVTSRKPDDLPAFIAKVIEEIDEGAHRGQTA